MNMTLERNQVPAHTKATRKSILTTERDVHELIVNIQLLHPQWKMSEDEVEQIVRLWHYSLKYYPVNQVKIAGIKVASESRFTPKLADIVELLKEKTTDQSNMIEDKSSLQWYLSTLDEEGKENFLRRSNALARGGEVVDPNQWEIERADDYKEIVQMLGK